MATPAAPANPAETRLSLAALPRMLPVVLEGIDREQLQRAPPGKTPPWPALLAHLAAGADLLARLPGAAAPVAGGEQPPDALEDVLQAFVAQRQALDAALSRRIAEQGEAAWSAPVAPGASTSPVRPTLAEAGSALVVDDRSLLVRLAEHRNWLKGR